MMMYEGLCFVQWSMTLMSNASFGCLASLHFSALVLIRVDWNGKKSVALQKQALGLLLLLQSTCKTCSILYCMRLCTLLHHPCGFMCAFK